MVQTIFVVNAQGQEEPFSFEKVYNSAKRAGASDFQAHEIAYIVQQEAYDGIKTWEIFDKVRKFLKRENEKASLRFSLKEAMIKLGPTGYTFEKYIGEVFEHLGYKVRLNQFIPGHCVTYEIDFIAEKDNFVYIGECKYHKLAEGKVDLQTVLANCARFHDILTKRTFGAKEMKSIIITNTKFTTEAIKYCACKHIDLLGWRHPGDHGLEYLIESHELYPVTILPSYKGQLAEIFLREKKMLVKDIIGIGASLEFRRSEFQKNGIGKAVKEAEILLNK